VEQYGQKNHMGRFANALGDHAEVLAAIRARKWDSNYDGTGDPIEGMEYYDETNHRPWFYNGTWTRFALVP
jgi:hypothetical protein